MEELTKQDQEFVKEVAITGNQTQSAKKAYKLKDNKYASVKGTRMIAKASIIKAVDKVKKSLAERISDDLLHKTLIEGLNAGKRIFKNNNETGEIEDLGMEPDYATRHKYLDSAYKLKGVYEVEEHNSINVLMPILVKFLNGKDDKTETKPSNNGNTKRISQTL